MANRSLRHVLRGASFAPLVILALGSPSALAQAVSPAELQGHSVIVDYQEMLHGGQGARLVAFNDRVYISTKGRIFHRLDRRGGLDGGRSREAVSEGGSVRGGRFQWDGQGRLVRAGRNLRGDPVPITITFERSGGGFTCAFHVDRSYIRASQQVVRNSCQVVAGNVF